MPLEDYEKNDKLRALNNSLKHEVISLKCSLEHEKESKNITVEIKNEFYAGLCGGTPHYHYENYEVLGGSNVPKEIVKKLSDDLKIMFNVCYDELSKENEELKAELSALKTGFIGFLINTFRS